MRLIDADACLEVIDANFFKTDPRGEEQLGFLTCRRLMREMPTIDAEPVRHGRWMKDKDDVFWGNHFIHKRCSECGKEPPVSRFGTGYALSRYCPNCGAKMDEEVRDD